MTRLYGRSTAPAVAADDLDVELPPGDAWVDGLQLAADGGPLDYADFRTGLTFAEVWLSLDAEARSRFNATGERMFVTRRTVLGRWRQLKLSSYRAYLRDYAEWVGT